MYVYDTRHHLNAAKAINNTITIIMRQEAFPFLGKNTQTNYNCLEIL